ncbi:MAG: class B sortase, partial [Oscillospiraceae bacterium]
AGDAVYDEASDLAQVPTLPPLPEELPEEPVTPETKPVYVDPYADLLRNMDFTALQKVNQQVQGWILIPNTALSYPLLQGEDNDYYLSHTYQKTRSAVGAIFMDYRSAADLSDFNTLIYGHRMNNGSMFASLKYYKKQSYWQKHKTVYLTTSAGSFAYEIFSAYEGSASGESYRRTFQSDEKKQAFLDFAVGASVIKTGITPTVNDSILTLSTCTGNGHANRLIVHAVRKNYAPSDAAEAVPEPEVPEPAAPPVPPAPEGTGATD